MKKILVILLLMIPFPAMASEQGAWVKVDANGNAIGGAIVCTPDVCGDVNSPYAKATLQPGEKYVLQTKADASGNVAGIGKQDNAEVKVNLQTNEWTITTKETIEIKPITPVVVEPQPITPPSNVVTESPTVTTNSSNVIVESPTITTESSTVLSKVKITADKTTVSKINDNGTTTVISQNADLDTEILETPPLSSDSDNVNDWYAQFLQDWQMLFNALAILFGGWILKW